jgi:LPXTG-motif cell wall-anchored protein
MIMKKIKRLFAFGLALIMCLGMAVTASAQTATPEDVSTDNAKIVINNASKGETYSVYKIFDATYNETTKALAYTYAGEIADDNLYFAKAPSGAITAKEAALESGTKDQLNADAAEWLYKNIASDNNKVIEVVSEGEALTIEGLEYGYYLIHSSLNGGGALAVNSTNPTATMNEKNTKNPGWDPDPEGSGKTVKTGDAAYGDSVNVNIGETVTFHLNITTQNYDAADKQIANYVFSDNALQQHFTNIQISSVKVTEPDGTVHTDKDETNPVVYSGVNGTFPITVEWVDDTNASKYKANSKLQIEYTAELDVDATIDGNGNTNTATFTYNTVDPDGGNPKPSTFTETDTATVYTYAMAFVKVNDKGTALSGATFTLPFSVIPASQNAGNNVYTVVKEGTEGAVKEVITGDDGVIIIKGVKNGTYNIQEKEAPQGYNKIVGDIEVTATKTGEETTETAITVYLDEDGNVTETVTETTVVFEENDIPVAKHAVVVNKTGSLLPSTGGIGTTIFYVVGGVLVAGAGILLITKKRMKKEQ